MSITLICGPMFANKSTRLHELYRQTRVRDNEATICLTPAIDTRYGERELSASHDGSRIYAHHVENLESDPLILSSSTSIRNIFIDEGQFLVGLAAFCVRQRNQGRHVWVAALNSDSQGQAWPEIQKLVPAHVDEYISMKGVCIVCKQDAFCSRKISNGGTDADGVIDVGGDDKYVCTCWKHFGKQTVITEEMLKERQSVIYKLKLSQ